MTIPHKKSALAAVVGTLLAGSAFGGGWTLFDEQDSTTDVVMNSCTADGKCVTPLNFNGDFYGDPNTTPPLVDLAVANDGGPIRFYLGTGAEGRGFSPSFELTNSFGLRSSGLRFADLDNDGDLEMVHTTRGGGNYVYRFRRAGAPFYCDSAPCVDQQLVDTRLGNDTENTQGLAVGDINLDCRIDVFVVNGVDDLGPQPNKVYLNQTVLTGLPATPPNCPAIQPTIPGEAIQFGAAIVLPSTGVGGADSDSRKVELVDVDGDGDLDAIVANADDNDNWLYINQVRPLPSGATLFAAPVPLSGLATNSESARGLAVGDLDNDGDTDIVVANYGAANRYYKNSGTGAAATRFSVNTGTFGSSSDPSTGVKLADMNRDTLLDAVVTNNPGPNRLHLLNGAAGGSTDYTIPNPTGIPGATPFNVSESFALDIGKLNNDGWPDLVVGNGNPSGQYNVRFLSNGECFGSPCNLFQNVVPQVSGAAGAPLTTPEDTPLTITAAAIAVQDYDNLAADHRMLIDPGTNYTVTSANPNVQTITPAANYSGPLTVNVRVTDLTSESAPAFGLTVTVTAVPDAPTFTSTPVLNATQGTQYSYAVTATDPDAGDTVTITAPTAPTWLTLTGSTLSGTPAAADIGDHAVTLEARDAGGLVATQAFTITVDNANDPPAFSSTAVTTATAGTAYSYAITTTDPDTGDTRTISGTTLPSWLTVTDNGNGTATLAGTPTAANVGSHNVVLRVADAAGAEATQTFSVVVAAAGGGTTPPPATSGGGGGGGGGGSAGVLEVLALLGGLGAALRRRRRA